VCLTHCLSLCLSPPELLFRRILCSLRSLSLSLSLSVFVCLFFPLLVFWFVLFCFQVLLPLGFSDSCCDVLWPGFLGPYNNNRFACLLFPAPFPFLSSSSSRSCWCCFSLPLRLLAAFLLCVCLRVWGRPHCFLLLLLLLFFFFVRNFCV